MVSIREPSNWEYISHTCSCRLHHSESKEDVWIFSACIHQLHAECGTCMRGLLDNSWTFRASRALISNQDHRAEDSDRYSALAWQTLPPSANKCQTRRGRATIMNMCSYFSAGYYPVIPEEQLTFPLILDIRGLIKGSRGGLQVGNTFRELGHFDTTQDDIISVIVFLSLMLWCNVVFKNSP